MPRERERRGSNKRVFTLTGLSPDERTDVGKMIKTLESVFDESRHFQSDVTHVICGKLSRSEKFLGALALGRWVVRPDYITASFAAGRWLDEVEYEWSSLQEDHYRLLATAAKRNRWRASTNTEKIFAGWQVAVVMGDTKRQTVYKRLLACGGAKICDIKLPTKNPARDSERLTYLFVDEATAPLTQTLQDYGVMCLNSDFISDYIVLYPPPEPLDYLLPADASHCPGEPAPGEVLYDGSVAMGSTEQNGAGSRSSAVAAQQSAAVDDGDNDMLVISQRPPSSPQERLFGSINEVDENGLVVSQCWPAPSQKSCTRSVTDVGDSVLETPEHPASQEVPAADVDVNTDDDNLIFISERIAPKGSKAMVAGGNGSVSMLVPSQCPSPQHGIHRPSQTPVGMTGIRDCHHPGLSQSGASASDCAGTLWLSMSADEDRLVLTDRGAGREEGKEQSSLPCSTQQGNCQEQLLPPASTLRQDGTDHRQGCASHKSTNRSNPSEVILASASSTITTTASSSDLSASSPIAATSAAASTASATTSCLKKERGDGDHQFTVADVKREMKMLKKEVTMGPAKQSMVSPALKKVQKSLREWFSPTGKENAEQEGLSKEARAIFEIKGQLNANVWSRAHRENEKTLGARPSKSGSAVNANRSKMSQSERASSQVVCKPSPSKCALSVGLSKPSASESVTDLTRPEPSSSKRASSPGVSKPSTSVNVAGSDRLKPSSSASKNTSNLDLFKPSARENGKHLNWPRLSRSECAPSDSGLSKPSGSERLRGLNWLEPSVSKRTSDLDLSEPSAAEGGKRVRWPRFSPSKGASDSSLSKPPSASEIVRGLKVKAPVSKCAPNIDLSKPSTSEGGRRLHGLTLSPSKCAPDTALPKPSASESVRSLSAAVGTRSVNLPPPSTPTRATRPSPTKPRASDSNASVAGEGTRTLDLGQRTGQEETGPVSTSSDALASLNARSKQSEVLKGVSGVGVSRTALTAAAQTAGAGNAHIQPASSEGAFSARPVNRPRSSGRTKVTTARVFRKRKKPDDGGTDDAEQPAAEAPPAELARAPPVKRQKTARGISQRVAMGRFLRTSGSVSGVERGPEAAQTGVTRVRPSSPAVQSGAADPLGKAPRLGSPFEKRSYAADLSSEPPHSSVTRRLPSTRWRLSGVPLPGQIDLSNCNASRLEQLGSRTFPESLSAMVSSCLDDNYFQAAVAMAMTVTTLCPSVEVLKHMVTVVKEAGNPIVVNQAYTLLMTWLDQFPPITPNLRAIYEEALAISDWETFRKILEDAVRESGSEVEAADPASPAPDRARLVLRVVVAALEKNFLHFAHSTSSQGCCNCLIIRCLWSPAYQVYPNNRCRDLLHFLETALMHHSTPQACWQELLNLVTMAAQCCHLVDNSWEWRVDGHVEWCSGTMVHELAHTIAGGCVDTVTRLQQVLACLSPPWLLRQVSAALLSDYDDYLVPGGLTSDPITMTEIVSKYFFLLPTLSAQNKSENASPRKKLKMAAVTKDENKAPAVDPKLTANKVNKKNPKGETLLHKAAIKNNISYLKQLLSVPGVDVNVQDYAGWTPLHEACNRGHTECVKALLKFAPSTATLDSFFQSGRGSKARRVDLHLANMEGITVLHDAVMNNHVGTVKLLLKYGGSSLLKAKTDSGDTPLDLATTEEMCMVLSRDSLDVSLSQESFSQDLDVPERESVPSSFMYREVLDNSDGSGSSTQLTASLEGARKFLALLTFLLRSHCQVRKQKQQQRTEGTEEVNLEVHAQCLRRHMRKITTDEVFSRLTVQLAVIEALLTQCC